MGETNKKKVLIVDDEPAVRQLVHRMLSKNYTVLEAQDGAEAVNMARSQKPDIILMDILMPKMDGITACYAIKTDQPTKEIPVVMLTAIGYDLNKRLSEDMGADGYVTKPFSSQALLETIRQLLRNSE
ncbi:MAG: response regulator [Dehalococcoidia bacterium]|nr:response regulator [Dehalococcoidia bacterium]MDH5782038.1 response regulator [Dehalococcoidia bacterium]